MKRKINRVGQNTLTVSLPTKWAQKHGLKQGDEVEVEERKNEILISTKKIKTELKHINVNLDSNSDISRRNFIIPYIRGYESIKIFYKDPSVIDFIEKNMFILTGFEIVEQTNNYLLLQNIVKTDTENFSQVFNRLFNVALSMLGDTKECFENGSFDNKDHIIKHEIFTNKLDFYCRRILNMHGHNNEEYSNSVYTIVREIEAITDILGDFLEGLPKNASTKNKNVSLSLSLLKEHLILSRKLYESKDTTLFPLIKKKETEYLVLLSKIDNTYIKTYLTAVYYPVHHISEEVY